MNDFLESQGTLATFNTVDFVLFSLVTSLLVIRGLKKECDYGYPIGKQHSGVLPYFENINW